MMGFDGDNATIRFTNMQEFLQRLNQVANEYPKTTEKHLRAVGNVLKRKVRAKTPDGSTKEYYFKSGKKKKSKSKLRNSWSSKIVGTSGEKLEYQLRSKSKRYHLVERGHMLVFMGHPTNRFVQGKWFFESAVTEFESGGYIDRQMQKLFDEIKRKLGA